MSAFGGKADVRLLPITVFIGSYVMSTNDPERTCLVFSVAKNLGFFAVSAISTCLGRSRAPTDAKRIFSVVSYIARCGAVLSNSSNCCA